MNMKRLKQECPVCLGKFKLKDMTETNCHHFFCDDCFFGILHHNNKQCAMCRQPQNQYELASIKIASIEFVDCYEVV